MLFTTKYWVATAFSDELQVWKTTTYIQILFLVEYLTQSSWAISALPRLYRATSAPLLSSDFSALEIMMQDIPMRKSFIKELFFKRNINGWLSSIEDKVELEICLFDKDANSRQLVLLETCIESSEKYFKDSLQRIKIYPTQSFFEQTLADLNKHKKYKDANESFKEYKRFINACIDEYSINGISPIEAKHHVLDLRTKLKI